MKLSIFNVHLFIYIYQYLFKYYQVDPNHLISKTVEAKALHRHKEDLE